MPTNFVSLRPPGPNLPAILGSSLQPAALAMGYSTKVYGDGSGSDNGGDLEGGSADDGEELLSCHRLVAEET